MLWSRGARDEHPDRPRSRYRPEKGLVAETSTGDTAVVKADMRQTNGSRAVIELTIGPQQGPALHTQHREDELRASSRTSPRGCMFCPTFTATVRPLPIRMRAGWSLA